MENEGRGVRIVDGGVRAVTPEEGYLAIEGGFFGVIGKGIGHLVSVPELERAVRNGQAEIEGRHAGWVEDEQSRFHLRFAALALASLRALREILPEDEALALLKGALIGPSRPYVLEGTRGALDHAPDPFAVLTGISKDKEAGFYGRTFDFECPQDDEHAYLVNITRCPGRHGFRFERPTTLSYGGDACRFWFIRTSSWDGAEDGTDEG